MLEGSAVRQKGGMVRKVLTASVPKIRAKKTLTSEVRPRRVEQWLESLPRASAQDTAQQLGQALFGQNRTALEAENRLSIMELYCEPVITAVEALQRTYASTSFPLSSRYRECSLLTARLLNETANGFKIVANDLTARGKANESEVVLALQRAMHFLGQLLVNVYQIYQTCPRGVWREMHQLYRYAEENQLLNSPVTAPDSKAPDGLATVADSYQQIILLGACGPYGLLQGECVKLYHLFLHWQGGAQITREFKKKDPAGRFVINLDVDAPPVPLIKAGSVAASDPLRLLDALDVLREIHSVLRSLERDSTLPTFPSPMARVGIDTSYVDLLRRAGRFLGGVTVKRRSLRVERDEPLSACFGVGTIHYYLNGETVFEPPVWSTDFELPADDVEDERPGELSKPEFSAQEDADMAEPGPPESRTVEPNELYTCRIRNASASGSALQFVGPLALQIKTGELIAVKEPPNRQWRIGAIRWLRCEAEDVVTLGFEMLAPEARPVAVRRESHGGFYPALMLPGNGALKLPTSLIVSRGVYRRGDKLVIVAVEDEPPQTVTPLRIVERSGSYTQLLLSPPPPRP